MPWADLFCPVGAGLKMHIIKIPGRSSDARPQCRGSGDSVVRAAARRVNRGLPNARTGAGVPAFHVRGLRRIVWVVLCCARSENPFIAGEPVTADNEMNSLAIVNLS